VGDEALPGAAETIAELRVDGKGVLFLTNTRATRGRDNAAKLERLGISATDDDGLTSGRAKAVHLARHEEVEGRTAHVIGTEALKDKMRTVGLRLLEASPAATRASSSSAARGGFDYSDLRTASQAVQGGARLYASQPGRHVPDARRPVAGRRLAPRRRRDRVRDQGDRPRRARAAHVRGREDEIPPGLDRDGRPTTPPWTSRAVVGRA
jgi:ribonucleotide monophosphatase NagD (HAD superfamily)